MSDTDREEILKLFVIAIAIGFLYACGTLCLALWWTRRGDGGDDWRHADDRPDEPILPRESVPVPQLKPEMVQ